MINQVQKQVPTSGIEEEPLETLLHAGTPGRDVAKATKGEKEDTTSRTFQEGEADLDAVEVFGDERFEKKNHQNEFCARREKECSPFNSPMTEAEKFALEYLLGETVEVTQATCTSYSALTEGEQYALQYLLRDKKDASGRRNKRKLRRKRLSGALPLSSHLTENEKFALEYLLEETIAVQPAPTSNRVSNLTDGEQYAFDFLLGNKEDASVVEGEEPRQKRSKRRSSDNEKFKWLGWLFA